MPFSEQLQREYVSSGWNLNAVFQVAFLRSYCLNYSRSCPGTLRAPAYAIQSFKACWTSSDPLHRRTPPLTACKAQIAPERWRDCPHAGMPEASIIITVSRPSRKRRRARQLLWRGLAGAPLRGFSWVRGHLKITSVLGSMLGGVLLGLNDLRLLLVERKRTSLYLDIFWDHEFLLSKQKGP